MGRYVAFLSCNLKNSLPRVNKSVEKLGCCWKCHGSTWNFKKVGKQLIWNLIHENPCIVFYQSDKKVIIGYCDKWSEGTALLKCFDRKLRHLLMKYHSKRLQHLTFCKYQLKHNFKFFFMLLKSLFLMQVKVLARLLFGGIIRKSSKCIIITD